MVPNRIFIGGLPYNTTERELISYFSEFGEIKTIKIIKDKNELSKGYGFITFKTSEEAQHLLSLEYVFFHGKRINIGEAKLKYHRGGYSSHHESSRQILGESKGYQSVNTTNISIEKSAPKEGLKEIKDSCDDAERNPSKGNQEPESLAEAHENGENFVSAMNPEQQEQAVSYPYEMPYYGANPMYYFNPYEYPAPVYPIEAPYYFPSYPPYMGYPYPPPYYPFMPENSLLYFNPQNHKPNT